MRLKFLKRIGVAALCLITVLGFMEKSCFVEAKDTNQKAHKAYAEMIKSLPKEQLDNSCFKYFTLYDLNGDGIDECIVNYIFPYKEGTTFSNAKNSYKRTVSNTVLLYTYYAGEVKKLYENFGYDGNSGWPNINKKTGQVTMHWHMSAFENGGVVYAIEKGAFKKMHEFTINDEQKEYLFDGKKMKQSTLMKKVEKMGVYNNITFKFYKGSEKNIKKYCG